MAIDSKNLLVWVKAMSRGNALPLDASEVYDSYAAAQTYAASATAYPGQTIKALMDDGTYHSFVLQPSDAGYTLQEVGALNEDDLKQYVQVVSDIYGVSSPEEGVVYIQLTDTGDPNYDPKEPNVDYGSSSYYYTAGGYIRETGGNWRQVFWLPETAEDKLDDLRNKISEKAPISSPVFRGTVKIGSEEVAVKSYVDGLIANLVSDVPGVLGGDNGLAVGDPHSLKAGQTFRVAEDGNYFGHKCEPGDLVILLKGYEGDLTDDSYDDDQVMVVQANVDGAVTSSATATTVGEIVVFDSVTGKVIKGSGVQIASLNDAIAKAHEHSNKAKLDTYDKTQAELLAAAKSEAQGLVSAHQTAVNTALDDKADKSTTLEGYGITDAYNKTEIDSKVKTITDNLNTKITSAEASTLITNATPGILESAAEAVETRLGDIGEDTVKKYIDDVMSAGGTDNAEAIRTAKEEAIAASNSYTDTQISTAMRIVEF